MVELGTRRDLSLNGLKERILGHGRIIADGKTIRAAAKRTGWSRTTVHNDVVLRLKKVNPALAKKVRRVLDKNFSEKYIRGGMATQAKKKREKGK